MSAVIRRSVCRNARVDRAPVVGGVAIARRGIECKAKVVVVPVVGGGVGAGVSLESSASLCKANLLSHTQDTGERGRIAYLSASP